MFSGLAIVNFCSWALGFATTRKQFQAVSVLGVICTILYILSTDMIFELYIVAMWSFTIGIGMGNMMIDNDHDYMGIITVIDITGAVVCAISIEEVLLFIMIMWFLFIGFNISKSVAEFSKCWVVFLVLIAVVITYLVLIDEMTLEILCPILWAFFIGFILAMIIDYNKKSYYGFFATGVIGLEISLLTIGMGRT